MLRIDLYPSAQALAIAQLAVFIRENRFHQQPLGLFVDPGINRINLACGDHVLTAGSTEQHRLSEGQTIGEHRRHFHAGFQLVVLHEAGEHLARLDHVTHLDGDVCHHPCRRRPQVVVAQGGFCGLHRFHRSDVLGAVAIQLLLRRGTGFGEVLIALVICARRLGFGFVLRQPGLLLSLIQHHQQLTGIHFIALLDLQLKDPTTRLSCQFHQIAGLKRADGVDDFSEIRHLGGHGLHLRWRRLLGGFSLTRTDGDQSGKGKKQSLRMTHRVQANRAIMCRKSRGCSIPARSALLGPSMPLP